MICVETFFLTFVLLVPEFKLYQMFFFEFDLLSNLIKWYFYSQAALEFCEVLDHGLLDCPLLLAHKISIFCPFLYSVLISDEVYKVCKGLSVSWHTCCAEETRCAIVTIIFCSLFSSNALILSS